MTQTISATETISRPPEHVWAVFTDWPGAVRWMKGIESMSIDGDTLEGARIRFVTRGQDRDSVIARCDPGRSIVLRSQQGGVTADYAYSLDSRGRIQYTGQPRGRVPLQWAAVPPPIAADRLRDPADRRRPDCGAEAGDRGGRSISARWRCW